MRSIFALLMLFFALSVSAQATLPRTLFPQNNAPTVAVQPDSAKVDSAKVDTTPVVIPRKPIKEHLAEPVQIDSLTTINETVSISEQGDAATIVEKGLKAEPKKVSGYRIVIFMKNAQSARREAVAVQEEFAAQFADVPSYMTYENPYFKISAGNCTTPEEAMILLGRLRKAYPKAFVVRENINIEEFAR